MESAFDLGAYMDRIGLVNTADPSLATLHAVVTAHCAAIPYENIGILLGTPPKLDLESLQTKMVQQRRGGYCFEQNLLLRAALRALGFSATGLIARVVRGFPADAPRAAAHMAIRVDLLEGPYLVDVGFGNLTPTAPLELRPDIVQATPHEPMRLLPVHSELVLQARLGNEWENLWRLCAHEVLDIDYDIASWFTATHPTSLFRNNMIVACAQAGGMRCTFLNGRVNIRRPDGTVDRRDLAGDADAIANALMGTFGLDVPIADIQAGVATLARLGQAGAPHRFFS